MGKEKNIENNVNVPSDGQLVRRAQRGSQEAFIELYGRYGDYPLMFALKLGATPMQAEDISSKTWQDVITKIGRIRKPDSFRFFLGTTARRNTSYLRRKARSAERWGTLFDMERQKSYDGESYQKIDDQDEQDYRKGRLLNALGKLTPKQQMLIRMYFLEGLSYKEMTKITGIKQGAFGPTIGRGLANLRTILGEDLEELRG